MRSYTGFKTGSWFDFIKRGVNCAGLNTRKVLKWYFRKVVKVILRSYIRISAVVIYAKCTSIFNLMGSVKEKKKGEQPLHLLVGDTWYIGGLWAEE